MAKPPNSVIGVDLGRHALKAVLIQRRGADKFAVTNYAVRTLVEPCADGEALERELKALFKEMGGSSKHCGIAISSAKALIRIIEQPETPPALLREALRLNGMALLNQDCRSLVLDCDWIPSRDTRSNPGGVTQLNYLVGGVPRTEITQIAEACGKSGIPVSRLQVAPICVFNAFEFAQPDVFKDGPFFLVDIGYTTTTVMVGVKGELVLVRSIDCGGRVLMETLVAMSGESQELVLAALEHDDELMVENARLALAVLNREIANSIGFFEGRHEENIVRLYISGATAKSKALLSLMSEEVRLPCESWNPLEKCEVTLSGGRAQQFESESLNLHVACGAAVEILKAQ